MTDHKAPDYDLYPTLPLESTDQYRALFEKTRMEIVNLLLERAATISELAETLDIPKGTIGHHVSVLETAGLVRVVRTKKVRAIEAKYYGRTARTYLLTDAPKSGSGIAPDTFLTRAASEYAAAPEHESQVGPISSIRYARIPHDRAEQWAERLSDLMSEFTAEERGGEVTYGLAIALYPTERPHLPDVEDSE